MMMKTNLLPLLLMITALLSMPLSADSRRHSDREFDRHRDHHSERRYDNRHNEHSNRRSNDRYEDHYISRQQAADIAQREHPGRVLGVKRKSKTYRVKTLNRRGELRETRINARSGKVVKRH